MHPVMHEVIKLCKSMETQAALFISEMVSHCALILCSINVARKAFLESTLCLCNLICNPLIPTDSTSLAPGQVGRRAEATVTHPYFSSSQPTTVVTAITMTIPKHTTTLGRVQDELSVSSLKKRDTRTTALKGTQSKSIVPLSGSLS